MFSNVYWFSNFLLSTFETLRVYVLNPRIQNTDSCKLCQRSTYVGENELLHIVDCTRGQAVEISRWCVYIVHCTRGWAVEISRWCVYIEHGTRGWAVEISRWCAYIVDGRKHYWKCNIRFLVNKLNTCIDGKLPTCLCPAIVLHSHSAFYHYWSLHYLTRKLFRPEAVRPSGF